MTRDTASAGRLVFAAAPTHALDARKDSHLIPNAPFEASLDCICRRIKTIAPAELHLPNCTCRRITTGGMVANQRLGCKRVKLDDRLVGRGERQGKHRGHRQTHPAEVRITGQRASLKAV